METETKVATEAVKKIAKWKIAAIAGAGLVVSVGTWAGLTKAGYVPNYLDIEILDISYDKAVEKLTCSEGLYPQKNCNEYQKIYNEQKPWEREHKCIDMGDWECAPKPKSGLIQVADKPVIYLYPTQTQEIKVQLDYQGELIADYPEYDYSIKGWEVIAYPDSTLINKADNLEYSYLFWEGIPSEPTNYDLSKGFVVKGEDTREFLQNKLAEIGLTPREYNEFIVYWYPKMKDNKYNLIHFAGKDYTDTAPLTITPTPDSILRVFMVFKPLDKEVEIEEQEIKPFDRKGFAVVEWGGTELK